MNEDSKSEPADDNEFDAAIAQINAGSKKLRDSSASFGQAFDPATATRIAFDVWKELNAPHNKMRKLVQRSIVGRAVPSDSEGEAPWTVFGATQNYTNQKYASQKMSQPQDAQQQKQASKENLVKILLNAGATPEDLREMASAMEMAKAPDKPA